MNIVELLVVIAAVGIAAIFAIVRIVSLLKRGRTSCCDSDNGSVSCSDGCDGCDGCVGKC